MIKRILALSMIVATAGFLVSPVSAQEEGFSASLSGQVRAQYQIRTEKTGKNADGEQSYANKQGDVLTDLSATNMKLNFNYTSGATTANAGINYVAEDGGLREYYSLDASTKADSGWTGRGVANFFKTTNSTGTVSDLTADANGNSNGTSANTGSIAAEDAYVSLSNDLLNFTLGQKEWLNHTFKGGAATYGTQWRDRSGNDSDYGTIDGRGRFNAFQVGVTVPDFGLDARVIYADNGGSSTAADQKIFGLYNALFDISADNNNASALDHSVTSTFTGVQVDYNNSDIGLDLSFEYGASSVKGNKDLDVSADGATASGSYMALGVAFTGVPDLLIGLNYLGAESKTAIKAERDSTNDYTEGNLGRNWESLGLAVDYTITDIGTVSFVYNNYTGKKCSIEYTYAGQTISGICDNLKDRKSTSMELGFQTTIANTLVRVSYYDQKNTDGDEQQNALGKDASYNQIRARMQYSF